MKKLLTLCFILVAALSTAQELEYPFNDGENIFTYTGFTLKYNEEHEQAEWVAYHFTAEEASGEFNRTDNFREDPRIETGTASLDDYRGSGYDRGHLAPAGDLSWSLESMSDSFYMSNMSPQEPSFNRVSWRQLEALIRDWAIEHGEIYVVTGPVLTDGPYESIGENEVTIPKYYYKVILIYTETTKQAIGFMMPNRRVREPLADFVVSVNFLEAITGIDFFHLLSDSIEEQIEAQANYSSW